MPLTKEEQAELEQLQSLGTTEPVQAVGLSDIEQTELDELSKLAPLGGAEIVSEPLTQEQEIQQQAAREELADVNLVDSAQQFLDPKTPSTSLTIKDTDTFTLLESVNQAKLFKDRGRRKSAFDELKRRGVPDEFIRTFTELDDAKGIIASMLSETPETVAGMVGAGLGALSGRGDPAAARRGAVIGAGVVAGATELGRELFERKFRPERRRGAADLAKDTAFTAATEALGEFGGRFIIEPAIGGLTRLGAKAAIPDAPRLSAELAKAGRQVAGEGGASQLLGTELPIQTTAIGRGLGAVGLNVSRNVSAGLLPEQQTASRAVATLTGLTEEFFLGGGKIRRTRDIAQKAALPRFVANKIDEITDGLDVLSLDEIGVLAQDAIHGSKIAGRNTRGASAAFNTVKRAAFKNVTDAVTEPIDISSAQSIAQGILDSASKGGTRLKLPEKTESILRNVVDTGSVKDMQDLIFARSDVGDLIRAAGLADEPKAKQVLAPVMKELTDLMKGAARKAGPEVVTGLDDALKLTAKGKRKFSTNLIRKLIAEKTPPEKVLRAVFGAPGDETLSPLTSVRNVKDVLLAKTGKTAAEVTSDKFAWDQLRFGWLTSKVKKAADIDGVLGGKAFADIVDNFGDTAMKEMFSPKELAGINDIILGTRLTGRKSRKIAGLIVKSAQAGGVVTGLATGKESLAIAALGGPAVLGQFLTSGAGKKLLTTGVPKGVTSAASGLEGQFIAGMLRTKKQMQAREKRFEKFQEEQRRQARQRKARPAAPPARQQRGFGGRGF